MDQTVHVVHVSDQQYSSLAAAILFSNKADSFISDNREASIMATESMHGTLTVDLSIRIMYIVLSKER